jgi:hypothetical protein
MLARLGPIVVVTCLLMAGCGGSGDDGDRPKGPATTSRAAPQSRDLLDLPAKVPLKGSGAADAAQASVIRAWADALRGGDVAAASALWAVPSTVQNATPLLTLRSRAEVRIFNRSLPCGAVVTRSIGARGGFTIVEFRLTERRGGACGSGSGNSARTAILVRGGKIVEWYRLPDAGAPAPNTAGPAVES